MEKIKLSNITLLGIDCINVERLVKALDISQESIDFGAVKLLTSLETDDSRKVDILDINSVEEYSLFCIRDLHRYVDTEFVLIIQYDGFIINPNSWTDEFLKYDYIGAPWLVGSWLTNNFPEHMNGRLIVGNGGFSLRSKKFLETSNKLYESSKIPKNHPEDVAVCVWHRDEFEKENIKFAPVEIAKLFSIEGEEELYKKNFGFHGFWCKDLNNYFINNSKYSFLLKYIKK